MARTAAATPGGYDDAPDLAWLYDQVPVYGTRRDVDFYVEEAKRSGSGGVLEMGCGTGRVLIPIARAGLRITGIDGSRAMIERCEAKLGAERDDVRSRVRLRQADIRVLEGVDAIASLAIAPFRVMQHLTSIADQMLFVAGVARHLAPGGRFVFDVFNPSFAMMVADRSAEAEDTPEFRLPDGRFMRRTVRVPRVRWVDQTSEIEIIYYLRDGNDVSRTVQAFDMRWYVAAELEHLLARAGFVIEAIYGNFDRSDLRDESPEIVIVAAKS